MVSIIVPFVDGGLDVSRTFVESVCSAVRRFNQPVQLVFAGSSTDGTFEGLKSLARAKSDVLLEIVVKGNPAGKVSYGENVNFGSKYAKYDILAVCNNDIVLPSRFFEIMVYSFSFLISAFERHQVPIAPGILGPLSNQVMAHQIARVSGLEKGFTYDLLETANANLVKQNKPPVFSSFVSGFCFVTAKKVFEELGGFDPELKNGNEDVDFCMRALQKGYGSYIVPACFVYHEGSHTMKSVKDNPYDGGTWNRHILAAKHWPKPRKWKIACGLRVKADESALKWWFDRNFALYDKIYVIDDGCGVDWSGLEEYYQVKNPDFKLHVDQSMAGEKEPFQRMRYSELAQKDGMDALVNLDHDEVFEPKVTKEYLQRLLNMPLPGSVGYNGPMLHLWNTPNTYRVGYPPTKHTFMVKLFPGLNHSFVQASETSFHCSRLPVTPVVGSVPTGVRVLHYGYMDPEVRKRKRQWYEKKDDVKNPMLIGNVDYSHMVDERMIRLNEWTGNSEDYTIALNTMFDNEKPHQLQIFFENFASVSDLIIARTSEKKSELTKIALRFGAKVYKYKWKNDYADARNFVLEKSRGKSAYVWFADPDERYADPQEIVELLQVRPTAVMFGVNNFHPKLGNSFSEAARVFANIPEIKFEGKVHESVEFALKELVKSGRALVVRASRNIDHYGFLWSDLDKKLEYYEKLNMAAIEEDPNDCRPYYNLALHKIEQGQFDEAITLLTRAITLEPRFTLAKIELAKAYTFAAYCLLDSCLTHVPDSHPLYNNIRSFHSVLRSAVPQTYFGWIDRNNMPYAFRRLGFETPRYLYDLSARVGEVVDVVPGGFLGSGADNNSDK